MTNFWRPFRLTKSAATTIRCDSQSLYPPRFLAGVECFSTFLADLAKAVWTSDLLVMAKERARGEEAGAFTTVYDRKKPTILSRTYDIATSVLGWRLTSKVDRFDSRHLDL